MVMGVFVVTLCIMYSSQIKRFRIEKLQNEKLTFVFKYDIPSNKSIARCTRIILVFRNNLIARNVVRTIKHACST